MGTTTTNALKLLMLLALGLVMLWSAWGGGVPLIR